MKLYAPQYYKDFVCIADKCRHSCCVGWEIDVDEDTLATYDSLEAPYANDIRHSIDPEGTPHFKLLPNDRCPHLDDRGLCRIITELGDGYLCHICREHPRFYHETAQGLEVGLGMACEEACRLILCSDTYQSMVEIGEIDGEATPTDFDPLPHRKQIYDILSDAALPYSARLQRIAKGYDIALDHRSDAQWRALLASLEYLNDDHRPLLALYSSAAEAPKEAEKSLERALAYFVFRHCSDAQDASELRAALGLALFCERLLTSMIGQNTEKIAELARILSEELEYSEENTEAIKRVFAPPGA